MIKFRLKNSLRGWKGKIIIVREDGAILVGIGRDYNYVLNTQNTQYIKKIKRSNEL